MTGLPPGLRREIESFFRSLPAVATLQGRAGLIVSAELDEELEASIDCSGDTETFCRNLQDQLTEVGLLRDGRDPVEAVLKAARKGTSGDLRKACDELLFRIRSEPGPAVGEERGRARRERESPLEVPARWGQEEILRFLRNRELGRVQESFLVSRHKDLPHICFLYGRSGVGTTTLLRLARRDLGEEAQRHPFLDWLSPKPKDAAVPVAGPGARPLMEQIFESFRESEQRSYFKDFRSRRDGYKSKFRSIIAARQELAVMDPELRDILLKMVGAGALFVFNLLFFQTTPMDLQASADVLQVSARALRDGLDWMEKHLSVEDRKTLTQSRKTVVAAMADGLAKYAQRHRSLIFAVDRWDDLPQTCSADFVEIVQRAGSGVFWLLGGKTYPPANPVFGRLYPHAAHFDPIPLEAITGEEIFRLLEFSAQGSPRRPLDSNNLRSVASRIHSVSQGNLLFVHMALECWCNGEDVEEHLLGLLMSYIDSKLEPGHRRLLFAFLLTPWESRVDRHEILKALCGEGKLRRLVTELTILWPAVVESRELILKIDSTVKDHVHSYLASDVVRLSPEIREIHTEACKYLEERRIDLEVGFSTLDSCLRNERWQEIELARLYHQFHLASDHAWMGLAAFTLGIWATRQSESLLRILEMLQSVRSFLDGVNGRRLERFEMGLSEQAGSPEKHAFLKELVTLFEQKKAREGIYPSDSLLEGLQAVFPSDLRWRNEWGELLAPLRHEWVHLGNLEPAPLGYRSAAAPSIDARIQLGALNRELGEWNEAKEMYLWALRSNPKDSVALRGAAESFASLELHQDAYAYFREAYDAGGRDPGLLRGLLFSRRKLREMETELGQGDLVPDEDLNSCLAEAEALVRSENCDLYDRSCLAALLGREGLALHLLRHAVSRDENYRGRGLDDPHLETLRSLPEFEELMGSEAEARASLPLRRRPIYVILGCGSAAVRLVADPETGLGLLCRAFPRSTRSCWLSVITSGPEARQVIPLTPVERFPLDSLEGVACSGGLALGEAFDRLGREMEKELWFPDGDDGAWVMVLLDSEPVDSWRWALDELRGARAGAIEKIVALGMNGVNFETLRSLAPFPPHERHLMPDPTPERLEAFFRGLAERCLSSNGKGGR